MVSQSIWMAIAVGTFFAGLGVGIAALQPVYQPLMIGNQMHQTMYDPQTMNQWHQQLRDDPQAMNQWMNIMINDPEAMEKFHKMMIDDPDHLSWMMSDPEIERWMFSEEHSRQMTQMMRENHVLTQGFMMQIIDDPDLRLQMLGHMSENPEAMNQMRMMVNGTYPMGSHMGQTMMSP